MRINLQIVPVSKRYSSLERGLDLTAIPSVAFLPMPLGKIYNILAIKIDGHLTIGALVLPVEAVDVHVPDAQSIYFAQSRIIEGTMNALLPSTSAIVLFERMEDQLKLLRRFVRPGW